MTSAIRNLYLLDAFRNVDGSNKMWGWSGDETCGAFNIPSPIDGADLTVIASAGEGWDHVSMSRRTRCPNYQEMEHVRGLFFRDDATVMQLSVPRSDHLSLHPYCLHWWRPHDVEIPRPPGIMVAPPSAIGAQ